MTNGTQLPTLTSYGATTTTETSRNSHQNQHNESDDDDDSYEIRPSHSYPVSLENAQPPHDNGNLYDMSDDDISDDDGIHPDHLSQRLLKRTSSFSLHHDTDRGFRGTQLKLLSFSRPHMRAFHGSWICSFTSCALQFAICPLLPEIATSLRLTKSDVWLTNIYSMVGGIPMGFVLGPLCDQYGARILIAALLVCCAIPCLLTGFVSSLPGLLVIRTVMGSMDSEYLLLDYLPRCLSSLCVSRSYLTLANSISCLFKPLCRANIGLLACLHDK